VVHAGGSPGAFSESGEDAEALEELEGFFGRFCFEAGVEAFEYRGSAAFFFISSRLISRTFIPA